MSSDERKLETLQATVDRAVLDATKWVEVCDRLAELIGGVGTNIAPDAAEYQIPALVVGSASLAELRAAYFREGWAGRDYRRRSLPLIRERGFATDYDIADERTLAREPFYADLMARHGLGTFVGLEIVTTSHAFVAAVERRAGAPRPNDDLLKRIEIARPILAGGARASIALGALQFETWTGLATQSSRAMFVLDYLGRVIDRNAATEPLLDGGGIELAQQRLQLRNPRDHRQLRRLVVAACVASHTPLPRPVFTLTPEQGGLMLEAVRIPDSLRFFHSLAAALLVVRPVESTHTDLAGVLRQQAGLTTAEIRVALALFEGRSLADYAQSAGISAGTARQQIKSVYRKTGTGRQNELSALIRRLMDSISN